MVIKIKTQEKPQNRFSKTILSALMLSIMMAPAIPAMAQSGPDTDADGVPDLIDLDDDNDGILDVNEGVVDHDNNGVADAASTDTDGDGTPDVYDLDSDNDGILDNLEAQTDRNAVMALDQNPNGAIDISFPVGANGIADAIETSPDSGVLKYALLDSDNDGAPDFRDTDSDNDGIFDLAEAGGTDADADGRIDSFADADGKGVADSIQASALPIFDTDGDGTLDFRDSDSDNDGIPDAVESFGSSSANPTDTDGDGAADYRELDSDGDGVPDATEAGATPWAPADTNNDGRYDFQDAGIQYTGEEPGNGNGNGNGGNGGDAGACLVNGHPADQTGPDTDGDGISNQNDLDDDNDGIPDSVEGLIDADGNGVADANSRDSDGDGTPDGWDLDSDNDGLLDNREAHPDFNFVSSLDQVVNGAIDIAVNVGCNGIPDIIETAPDSGSINFAIQDTDGDGTPDFMDLDSDNDGITDLVEAGGVDADNDGRIDNFFDADSKGVDDAVQSSALPVFDTDGDGVADYRDSDSDNDQIPDSVEAGATPNMPRDTDMDGAADYRETDSDGDGISDTVEAGLGGGNGNGGNGNGNGGNGNGGDAGVCTNGVSQAGPDTDGDGISNQNDLDDDNDGIPDTVEGLIDADGNGVADANSRDTDGDGTPDGWDLDSDNDGLLDNREAHPDFNFVSSLDQVVNGAIDISVAVGCNGLANIIENGADSGTLNFEIQDTDGDGVPDFMDLDSDNDGIPDLVEAGGIDADGDGRIDNFFDGDDKGVDDAVQSSALPVFDTNGNGVADYRDTDSDGDSIPDSVEAGAMPSMPVDTDGDGAPDYREQDSDNDSVSDSQEVGANPAMPIDSDGNGIADFQDSGTFTGAPAAGPVSDDVDGDGIPNAIDLDDDNDGILDSIEGTVDSDNDTTIDQYDLDSDNDGITDLVEAANDHVMLAKLDTNNDGRVDGHVGANGFADELESTPDSGTSIFTILDTDGDGVPDYKDLDSDNDGISDAHEAGHASTDSKGRLSTASNNAGMAVGASNHVLDTDADGVVDHRDLDSDNDGLSDVAESKGSDSNSDGRVDDFGDFNGDGAHDGLQTGVVGLIDTDSDRAPDYRDLDSDQDGLSDLLESQGMAADLDNNGVLDAFLDGNNDGHDDNTAANPVLGRDTDRDGTPDYVDLDSDNDGLSDLVEAGGADINNDGKVDMLEDTDNDGIPDMADASVTRGTDSDQDGIDDMFDVTFTGTHDTDGDGIADEFDPDLDGNGFVGPSADGQGSIVNLPDSNSNGIPDIQESGARANGVETGLGGTGVGCSVSPTSKGPDPLLLLMLFASVASLGWRSLRRVASRPAANRKGLRKAGLVVAASVSALTVSGCSSLGLDGIGSRLGNLGNIGSLGGERASEPHKARIYAGAGGLVSFLEPNASKDNSVSVDETQSFGGSVQLGYDISNRFSVEGHASALGEATLKPAGSIGYQVAGASILMYGLNNVDDRARREGFSVFGRLGAGTMRNQGDGVRFERLNDYHLLAGAGVEYGMSNGLAVRGEVVAHETDAKYAQIGLVYRIGDAGRRRAPQALDVPTPMLPEADAFPEVYPEPTFDEPMVSAPMDTDFDGVMDAMDSCPTTTSGVPVDAMGCAIFNGVIEGINFESGSDRLTLGSEQILNGVASTLSQYPDLRVSVEAHTDNQGPADFNLQLSKRRAIAVARYLVEQGIAGPRLKPQAFGESQPRESNATPAGRSKNRRVEFQVVQ